MAAGAMGALLHLGAVLVGAGFLVQGGLLFRQRRQMTAPGAEESRAVTAGDTVAIEGTARATPNDGGDSETITAPLSGATCVLAAWRVEEFYGHELATQSGWTEQGSGYDAVRFDLVDGSGTIPVDVGGEWELLDTEFDLAGLDAPRRSVSIEDDVPAAIRAFETSVGVEERTPAAIDVPTSDDGPAQGDRRYYEATIAPGDDVFVSGVAVERDDETGPVVTDGADDRLLISDAGRAGAARDRLFGGAVLSVVGAGLLWYGVAPFV